MRVHFAAAVCAWGYLTCAGVPAFAAEITDLASSFEKDKPFGFKLGATYNFSYKTASITRESLPQLQSQKPRDALFSHYAVTGSQSLQRTAIVPDLLYTQRRQTLSLDLAIGIFQDLQLGISVPFVLRDERSYDLDRNAGFNTCPDDANLWSCVASYSSTYLDGIYPIQPGDQSLGGSRLFQGPIRGGSGANLLDTINLSLMGAPVSQRRDPTKPTWVIGIEGQISVGTIMNYDNTRRYLNGNDPANPGAMVLYMNAADPSQEIGWHGVSEGVHRIIVRTALSHRFRYVDPYLGLWYLYPIPRTNNDDNSPWKPNYGIQQKHSDPQQQAGAVFGFEATPFEKKDKGHRLALDFRGGLSFHFLGRGYSEAWELLAASNALICDDQTALPPPFNYKDTAARPGVNNAVTQGTFNPACREPASPPDGNGMIIPGDTRPRLPSASAYYQRPYTGLSLIENYLTFTAEVGVVAELFKHARLRAAFRYQRDQGHVITEDDAGITSYNGRPAVCNGSRVDLRCASDWNPAYRAAINEPGRRYRVDDINVYNGSVMLQAYW